MTCADYHSPPPDLPYLAWHEDADRRHAAGEDQIVCPCCVKYIWRSFYHRVPVPRKLVHLGGRYYVLLPREEGES